MYWQISVHRKPAISSHMLYVILLTHLLEFLSWIISLNTAGENHAGIQHSSTQNTESEESIYGNLDIFIAFWCFKERTNTISIPFLENEWSWGVQCHQDSLVSYCSFSFSNFQLYALCYTSDTFPWIPFLCRMSHYQSEYCQGKPCWHTTFMNSEHRIRRGPIAIPCHQDSLVSYCSFSFHTGVTCID